MPHSKKSKGYRTLRRYGPKATFGGKGPSSRQRKRGRRVGKKRSRK